MHDCCATNHFNAIYLPHHLIFIKTLYTSASQYFVSDWTIAVVSGMQGSRVPMTSSSQEETRCTG